jgi:hypothetical protein
VGKSRRLPKSVVPVVPGLTTNIRLGWKGLPGTNTLNYENSLNYGV